ncbi:MAG: iron ABC transporter permease [Thermodesulfovibrionales bacterium]|nr:iron ABC transporter permease [Thermodesulfovibrionales bacterium]
MNNRLFIALLYIMPFPLILISLFLGPTSSIGYEDVLKCFSSANIDDTCQLTREIVLNVRLPRILLTFLIGAALTISGNSLQMLFKNPLVSPDILGLSAGAVFGAALSLAYGIIPLQLSAFVFGLLAVFMSYLISKTGNTVSTITLILSGIIITGIFTAFLSIVQFLTDPFKLQSIVHWTMGNLHNASWEKLQSSIIPISVSVTFLIIMRWRLNVIALGDEETKSVGLNPHRQKLLIIVLTTLATSSSVAVSGMVVMVGLVVPHMVRMLIGPDNIKAQPLMAVVGGSFLLIVDNLCRTVSQYEIPISIFTTLIGAPFFIYLIKKGKVIFREM